MLKTFFFHSFPKEIHVFKKKIWSFIFFLSAVVITIMTMNFSSIKLYKVSYIFIYIRYLSNFPGTIVDHIDACEILTKDNVARAARLFEVRLLISCYKLR